MPSLLKALFWYSVGLINLVLAILGAEHWLLHLISGVLGVAAGFAYLKDSRDNA